MSGEQQPQLPPVALRQAAQIAAELGISETNVIAEAVRLYAQVLAARAGTTVTTYDGRRREHRLVALQVWLSPGIQAPEI